MLMQTVHTQPLVGKQSFSIIRHGQTLWNAEDRLQGRTDIELNAEGIRQAEALARQLDGTPITMLVTSPLKRAYETSVIIGKRHKLSITKEPALTERSFGSFEKRYRHEILAEQNLPREQKTQIVYPEDAETENDVRQRALACIQHWLDKYPKEHIAFIGHSALFRILHKSLNLGEGFNADYAKRYILTPTLNGWNISE
ncbi:MAG: hypothetical protein DI585_05225 [Pseudomonas fluorescens]|nr:MAG: hypothetical protein DI585_05225 [Pseudomonas fluorescens]